MRFRWFALLLGLTTVLLGACSEDTTPPITPATEKLTFLFFYTEG
jgi:hypothetical protein